MESQNSFNFQILNEDLQIVRATLATIAGGVKKFSDKAGHAVTEALEKLDHAQAEFKRSPKVHRKTDRK